MKQFLSKLIWCIPTAGLLFSISILLRGQVFDVTDTENFLKFALHDTFQLGATWNVFNFIILFLGVIGLGLYSIEQTGIRLAKIAFSLLFIAHCLTFCYLGLLAFIYGKAASLALENKTILDLFDLSNNTAIIPVVVVDSVTFITGTILTVYVLIKHKLFPQWTSIVFGLSFFLVGVIPPATLSSNADIARISEIFGNILIFVSGLSMALTIKNSRINQIE